MSKEDLLYSAQWTNNRYKSKQIKLHISDYDINGVYKLFTRDLSEEWTGEWIGSFDYVYSRYQSHKYDKSNYDGDGADTLFYECDKDGNELKLLGGIAIPAEYAWRIGSGGNSHGVVITDLSYVTANCYNWPNLQVFE